MSAETSPSRIWRRRKQFYSLVGEVCFQCNEKIFPPRDICPHCGKNLQVPFTFSGRGEVYSFTTVLDAPAGFENYAPYKVALIKLEEGPIITAQLTDVGNAAVEIGMKVEMVTRKLREHGETGLIEYGYKFRPLISQDKHRQ